MALRRMLQPSKKGLPRHALVSDRWHLVKNLAACVSVQLAQSLAELRRAEQVKAQSEKQERGQVSEERHPAQTRAIQHAQLVRQAERMARYEHIVALQKQAHIPQFRERKNRIANRQDQAGGEPA